jgi:hypothetical protein
MARYAFLSGHNGPKESELDNLNFVGNDVNRIAEVFYNPPSSYDNVYISSINDSPAKTIRDFESMASSCSYHDSLVFYFSGHGHYQRGQLYLIWEETDFSKLISTSLPIALVKSIFANSKAIVRLLILDCCHSGAAGEAQFSKGRLTFYSNPLFEAARDSASLILTACGRNSATREIPELRSGYLTYLLVEALSNRFAEADSDRDGLLSIQEFVEWCSKETTIFNKTRSKNEAIDPPELYGDFRSAVYLTAHRVSYNDKFTENLNNQVRKDVSALRTAFRENKWLDYKQLEILARPLRRVAPTFTDLKILDELFEVADDAAIFAAAVILQIRHDPNYMEKLITHVDNKNIRGSTNWRVLRAVRDTIPSYKLSEQGRKDLIRRLHQAAIQRHTKRGKIFAKGTTLDMIQKICKKLRIPYNEVFAENQLKELRSSG